jgi:streptogramin lyase
VVAALNIARNPATGVASLFSLVPSNVPFQPTLASAPNDWTIAVQYKPAGLNVPNALAIDANGNVWIANCGSALCATTGVGSVAELANTGALIGSTSAGGINVPYALAIDLNSNAWVANYGGNSITELNTSLAPVAAAYTGGGLSQPNSIAIDNAGNAWLTNAGVAAISEFSSSGTAISGSGGIAVSGVSNPIAIAINPH